MLPGLFLKATLSAAVTVSVQANDANLASAEVRLNGIVVPSTFTVEDDGIARDSNLAQGGLGLRTMRYRARLLGGTLDLSVRPGGGLAVCCAYPLPSAPGAAQG